MGIYYVSAIKKTAAGGIDQLYSALLDPTANKLEPWQWFAAIVVKKAIAEGHQFFTSKVNTDGTYARGALIEVHLTTHADHSLADNLRSLPVIK